MPTYPTVICTLDDVKDFIGIPSSQTTKDLMLQRYIDAATRWATYVSDAIIPTAYAGEVHSGGGETIVLFNTPILTVESVVEYWNGSTSYTLTQCERGQAISPYSFSVDNAEAGILTRIWSGFPGQFVGRSGMNNIVVSYTAGFATVPEDIQTYVLMDIQGLYDASQQGSRPSTSGASSDFGYSPSLPLNVFPRLASLMASSRRVPAIG